MNPTTTIDDVVELAKALRLPHIRRHAPDLLATAKTQRWDPAEAIRALPTEELAGRNASSVNTRRTTAGFPAGKTFDTWDQTISSFPEPTQRSLATLEWIERHDNLAVCGPSGTGKSHILEALGPPQSTTAPTSHGSASRPSAVSFTDTEPTTQSPKQSAASCGPT